jgi:hypothetical protein
MTIYATSTDYEELVGAAPAGIDALLRRASRDIDRALASAVYDTSDGVLAPAGGELLADVLMEATCEQAAWHVSQGRPAGIATGASSVSIGSASVTYAGSAAGGGGSALEPQWLAEQAYAVLQRAGLTAAAPFVCR